MIKKTHNYFQQSFKNKGKVHWLLQEYIINPMLYEGKKFHIRAFYILTSTGEQYLCDIFHIIYAKKKYNTINFNDKDVHDTHSGTGLRKDFWEKKHDGFTDKQFKEMKDKIITLHKSIGDKLKYICYEGVDNCFNIFGSDIMFTDKGECKLLEINKTPGFKYNDLDKYIYEGIFSQIIDKIYPPFKKVRKNNNLIKLN
jgi:tubulin---tyrosine ligase